MAPQRQSFWLPALANLLLLFQLVPQGTTEIAYVSSITSRKVLIRVEQLFVGALHNYSQLLEAEIGAIHKYLNLLQRESDRTTASFDASKELHDDPLHEYFKLESLAGISNVIESHSEVEMAQTDLQRLLLQARSQAPVPSVAEQQLSLRSLLHSVRTFELEPNQLAAGLIDGLQTASGLSVFNCLEIATFALREGQYRQSIEFLEAGKKLLDSNRSDECVIKCPKLKEAFEQVLADAVQTHDLNLEIVLDAKDHSKVFKSPLNFVGSPEYELRTRWDLPFYNYGLSGEDSIYVPEMFHNHEKLCRDEVSKPLLELPEGHKCFLLSQHPNNFLSPAKIQVLHRDPLIFQVYDAISELESQRIIQAASPSLFRSPVLGKPGAQDQAAVEQEIQLAFHRSSQSTWIQDQGMSSEFKIEKALGNVINVELEKMLSAENSQVANYASGGQYIPHPDAMFVPEYLEYASEDDKMAGDRLITFMIYLNNVTLGGGTAFPFLGVVAKPEPRSALVWFNLKADMDDRDLLTVHGGCPILYGEKWIANKWIRTYNQMFHIQCPKDQYHHEYFYRRLINN